MKKVFLLLLVMILVFLLVGCDLADEESVNEASPYFVAKVTDVYEGSLGVEIIDKGSSSLGEGSPAQVSTRFEGYNECSVGDTVQVEFDGVIQEIYPPIIPNVISIQKK